MIAALNWAFGQDKLYWSSKFVLVALADYASESGTCWPSLLGLSKKTGFSPRQLIRILAKLEKGGFIKDTGKTVGATNRTKVYQLVGDVFRNSDRMSPLKGGNSDIGGGVIVTSATGNGDIHDTTIYRTHHVPTKEPPVQPRPSADALPPPQIPPCLDHEDFKNAWERWMKYRRGFKRVKDWAALFSEQLTYLARFDAKTATEMLSQSMRNGYQGIFELKGTNGNGKSQITNGQPTDAQMIAMTKERERIAERLKVLRGQASHDVWGAHYDSRQLEERNRLRNRDNELKKLLRVMV